MDPRHSIKYPPQSPFSTRSCVNPSAAYTTTPISQYKTISTFPFQSRNPQGVPIFFTPQLENSTLCPLPDHILRTFERSINTQNFLERLN